MMNETSLPQSIRLIAKCVGCGYKWDAGEPHDVPMCPKCFAPGVVERVVVEK